MQQTNTRYQRLLAEVRLLAYYFGSVDFDDGEGRWVFVKAFPLPPGWNANYSPLLIWLHLYPENPPVRFCLKQGLRDHKGRSAARYLVASDDEEQKGWFTFCYYFKKWQPAADIGKGDNLLSVARKIYEILRPERMGKK